MMVGEPGRGLPAVARLLVVSRSMALAMRLADAHEVVEHPVEAIDEITPNPDVDVVVLDVGEPQAAIEALDRLRATGDSTPVLIVSGYQPAWASLVSVDLPDVVVVPLPITRAALLDGVAELTGPRATSASSAHGTGQADWSVASAPGAPPGVGPPPAVSTAAPSAPTPSVPSTPSPAFMAPTATETGDAIDETGSAPAPGWSEPAVWTQSSSWAAPGASLPRPPGWGDLATWAHPVTSSSDAESGDEREFSDAGAEPPAGHDMPDEVWGQDCDGEPVDELDREPDSEQDRGPDPWRHRATDEVDLGWAALLAAPTDRAADRTAVRTADDTADRTSAHATDEAPGATDEAWHEAAGGVIDPTMQPADETPAGVREVPLRRPDPVSSWGHEPIDEPAVPAGDFFAESARPLGEPGTHRRRGSGSIWGTPWLRRVTGRNATRGDEDASSAPPDLAPDVVTEIRLPVEPVYAAPMQPSPFRAEPVPAAPSVAPLARAEPPPSPSASAAVLPPPLPAPTPPPLPSADPSPAAAPASVALPTPVAVSAPPALLPPPLPPVTSSLWSAAATAQSPPSAPTSKPAPAPRTDDGLTDEGRLGEKPLAPAMRPGPVDTRSLILPYSGPSGPRLGGADTDAWEAQNFDWWNMSTIGTPAAPETTDPEPEPPSQSDSGPDAGQETADDEPDAERTADERPWGALAKTAVEPEAPTTAEAPEPGVDVGMLAATARPIEADLVHEPARQSVPPPIPPPEPVSEPVLEPVSEPAVAEAEPDLEEVFDEPDALARVEEDTAPAEPPSRPGHEPGSGVGSRVLSQALDSPAPRIDPVTEPLPRLDAAPVAWLVSALTERANDLFGVADTAQALADEIVERAEADAAAVLVPDGGVWRVCGGVGLRPLERRLVLDTAHWLISEIALGGRALMVEDADAVRPKLAGAPLAAWRHLLAVPVPSVRAAVVLARGHEAGAFGGKELDAVVEPIREGAALLETALQTRRLARLLAPLREVDSSH